jgi:prephenate dehydrogenase
VRTVAIVGVGLIGGSFALALRRAGFDGTILGVSSAATLVRARELNVIDEGLTLEEAVPRADLIYLAQPITGIVRTLQALPALVKPGALVTDAGSTKGSIVSVAGKVMLQGFFLGGHPMAGKESRGVEEAEATLFQDRTYVLTPQDPAELDRAPVAGFLEWVHKIGARPLVLSPDEHDRVVALTSHLPQLASTALAATLDGQLKQPEHCRASGPGLADQTRLALSSFEVWGPILASNRSAIDSALGLYIAELEAVRAKLASTSLSNRFESASAFAKKVRQIAKDQL